MVSFDARIFCNKNVKWTLGDPSQYQATWIRLIVLVLLQHQTFFKNMANISRTDASLCHSLQRMYAKDKLPDRHNLLINR